MAVSYAQVISTDMIVSEIENIIDWRNEIIRQCFFPGSQTRPAQAAMTSDMLAWCRREADRGTVERAVVERLAHAHEEMGKAARLILDHCAPGTAPTLQLYDGLENQCDNFINHIRRLQQDLADSSTAVDAVTGLRTVAGMRNDIQREQDRYDRKGTSFSIANIEIDSLDDLLGKYDRRSMDFIYASVAALIARTVRSFDDAYFLGKGEYILVLKHVEFMDACSVMDRLRTEIETHPLSLPSGEKLKITASFGIAEAIQREKPEACIGFAKQVLEESKRAGGNRITEYHEMSALAQVARERGRDGI